MSSMSKTAAYDPATGNYLGVKLSVYAITQAILALTSTQQTNIWNNVVAVVEVDDYGQGGVAYLAYMLVNILSLIALLTGTLGQLRALVAALIVRDIPTWLVTPSFDTTINVPGWTSS